MTDSAQTIIARDRCKRSGVDPDSTIMSGYYSDLTGDEFAALDGPPIKVETYPKIAWRTFRAVVASDISALKATGWAVVPAEPTEAMAIDGYNEAMKLIKLMIGELPIPRSVLSAAVRTAYKAMIKDWQ